METLKPGEPIFILWAFLLQGVLLIHFTIRKRDLPLAIRYGWIVYLLFAAGLGISIYELVLGADVSFWVGGIIAFIWALFGLVVEYGARIQWRAPIRWPVFLPYVVLYLGTLMFYWWPLALIYKPLWYVYAVLFILSTWLNVRSHGSKNRKS